MKKHFHANLPASWMAIFLPLAAILILVSCDRGQRLSPQDTHGAPSTASEARHERESIKAEEIYAKDLPLEAQNMLQRIKIGGPFPYAKDGAAFGNREEMLPKKPRGYYREYTVKTPGIRDRGARRIISGKTGEYYYTDDHYSSFKRIRE